jgi:hypothetical protein
VPIREGLLPTLCRLDLGIRPLEASLRGELLLVGVVGQKRPKACTRGRPRVPNSVRAQGDKGTEPVRVTVDATPTGTRSERP